MEPTVTACKSAKLKIGSRGLHVATSVRRRLKKKKRERKETEMESNLIVWSVN